MPIKPTAAKTKKESFFDDDFSVPIGRGRGGADNFSTFSQAKTLLRQGGREPRAVVRLSIFRKIALTFVGIAILSLGLVVYISLAKAVVTITPRTEILTDESEYSLGAENTGAKTVTGYVLETVVDGVKTVAVTGKNQKTVEGNSCGDFFIVNKQSKDQPLVEKTRLLTSGGVLFRLTKSVTAPAGGEVSIRACADQKGKSADIDPTTLTIPGLSADLQKKTYAELRAPTRGGEVVTAVLEEADIAAAIEEFEKELAAKGLEKLAALVPAAEAREKSFETSNLVKKETDAKAGSEQSSYNLSLSVHVAAVFYDPRKLSEAAGAALRAKAGSDRELLSVDESSLKVELKELDESGKKAAIKVVVSGLARVRDTSVSVDKSKIAGLSPKDAKRYLESLPFVEKAEIVLRPSWSKHLPSLKDHIDVVIANK
jgi:hypothetical protein